MMSPILTRPAILSGVYALQASNDTRWPRPIRQRQGVKLPKQHGLLGTHFCGDFSTSAPLVHSHFTTSVRLFATALYSGVSLPTNQARQ